MDNYQTHLRILANRQHAINNGRPMVKSTRPDYLHSYDVQHLEALSKSFGEIVKTYSKAAFVTDEFGTIAFLNAAAETLTGRSIDKIRYSLISEWLFDFRDPLPRDFYELLLEALNAEGVAARSMVPITTRNRPRLANFNVFPLINDAYRLHGAVVIAHEANELTHSG